MTWFNLTFKGVTNEPFPFYLLYSYVHSPTMIWYTFLKSSFVRKIFFKNFNPNLEMMNACLEQII